MAETTEEELLLKAKTKSIEVLEKEIEEINENRQSIEAEINSRERRIKEIKTEIEDFKKQSSKLYDMKDEISGVIRDLKEAPAESPDAKRLTSIIKATIDSLQKE